jgi:hypothetical protein
VPTWASQQQTEHLLIHLLPVFMHAFLNKVGKGVLRRAVADAACAWRQQEFGCLVKEEPSSTIDHSGSALTSNKLACKLHPIIDDPTCL